MGFFGIASSRLDARKGYRVRFFVLSARHVLVAGKGEYFSVPDGAGLVLENRSAREMEYNSVDDMRGIVGSGI
jgi:hypothetical protein